MGLGGLAAVAVACLGTALADFAQQGGDEALPQAFNFLTI